ncbi:MAG: hypothetical protein J5771_00680 [Bacteroidales bacterium]|nr:hypothetical protein [Bacteroidales bacterium]
MKKLLTAFILLALAVPALAGLREDPHSNWVIRGSAAYIPSVPYILLPWLGIAEALSADEDAGEKAELDFPPYMAVEGMYSFNDRWSVGASLGYCGLAGRVRKADGTVKDGSRTSLVLLPLTVVGRCNYVNHPAFKLYGTLEAGAMFSVSGGFSVVPDVQINPIGTEFGGRRLFGLFELGFGMNYFGARVGMGYRF